MQLATDLTGIDERRSLDYRTGFPRRVFAKFRTMPPKADPPASPPTKRSLPLMAGGGAVLLCVGLLGVWYGLTQKTDPAIVLNQALAKLDEAQSPADWERIGSRAQSLQNEGYQNPAFPGALPFLSGMSAFHAEAHNARETQRKLQTCVSLLREAQIRGVDPRYSSTLTATLGLALFQQHDFPAARPLLEEAYWTADKNRLATGLALVDTLDALEPLNQERNFKILEELAASEDLSIEGRHDVDRKLARSLMRVENFAKAEEVLQRAQLDDRQQDARLLDARLLDDRLLDDRQRVDDLLLRAELRLAQGNRISARTDAAAALAADPDHLAAATAMLILGRCAEAEQDIRSAVHEYERAVHEAPNSEAGAQAALRAATIFQLLGRDEESQAMFAEVIKVTRVVQQLPKSAIRKEIDRAFHAWLDAHKFNQARMLVKTATVLLEAEERLGWLALIEQAAADQADREWRAASQSDRKLLAESRRQRWLTSAEAHAAIAAVVADQVQRSKSLWLAAEQFRLAHAYAESENCLTEFLDEEPGGLQASALLLRGKVRLDRGATAFATEDFQHIIDTSPTSPTVFEARYYLGAAALAEGNHKLAEARWRSLLKQPDLSPVATEWRMALFALAHQLRRHALTVLLKERLSEKNSFGETAVGTRDEKPSEPLTAAVAAAADESDLLLTASKPADETLPAFQLTDRRQSAAIFEESVDLLGEFLTRYPNDPRSPEANVLYGDALRYHAVWLLSQGTTATTLSNRNELMTRARAELDLALAAYKEAQARLLPQLEANSLDALQQDLLETATFSLAAVYAAQGRKRESIIAFGSAINRFPADRRVLPAYLAMANLHRQANEFDEAQAKLVQARLFLDFVAADRTRSIPAPLTQAQWDRWLIRLRNLTLTSSGGSNVAL